MFDSRFKLSWDESVAQFSETLPWQLIALCIVFGTFIVVWAIIYFGDCCLGSPKYYKQYNLDKEHQIYHKKTRRCGTSILRLSIVISAVVVGSFGFWIACNTAGVSFWNILFGYGIAAFVMTYSFGTALQSAGAYFLIALTNKLTEGWYIEFVGMPVEGRVTAINILWVELEYIDPVTNKFRDLFVPTTYVISSIYLRNFGKEAQDPAELTTATAARLTGLKIQPKRYSNV
jgi:hypothetical protein